MKLQVVAIGGATEDISFHVEDYKIINDDRFAQKLMAFDYGAKIGIKKIYLTCGGGAANVSVALAKLGVKVGCLTVVGDDERGRKIVRNLKKHRVVVNLIKRIKNDVSSFSFVVVGRDNEHIVFSSRAVANKLEISADDLKKIKKSQWLHVASLSGDWQDNLNKLFSLSNKKSWNPGQRQIEAGLEALSKYLKKTDVLTLNKEEALRLVMSHRKHAKLKAGFLDNSKNLLKILRGYGPKLVIITNGRYGVDASDGKNVLHQAVIRPKARIDTTGVGDAFCATMIFGLLNKFDLKKCLKLASRNAAAEISEQGAQTGLLDKKQLIG